MTNYKLKAITFICLITLLISCDVIGDAIEAENYRKSFDTVIKRHIEQTKKTKFANEELLDIQHLPKEPSLKIIIAINNFINTLIEYRKDRGDKWQTPFETLERGYGDCEDFAIFKYVILKQYGFKDEDLKFMISQHETNYEQHAYLEVKFKDKIYFLDNFHHNIYESRKNYKPKYAITRKDYTVFKND